MKLRKIKSRISRWRELEGWQRYALVRLFILLHVVWFGLRIVSFQKMHRFVDGKSLRLSTPRLPASISARSYAQSCYLLAETASRYSVFTMNCLPQSLALCWLLRRHGLPAKLRIGVLRKLRPFKAHAWVELDHVPLERAAEDYQAFHQYLDDMPEKTGRHKHVAPINK